MQKMIDDIRQDALEEARKIRKDFSKQKKKLLSEAEEKAESMKKELIEKGKKLAELEKVKIISQANLNAKREKLKAMEELCNQVLEKSVKDLDSVTEEKKYKDFLNKGNYLAWGIVPTSDKIKDEDEGTSFCFHLNGSYNRWCRGVFCDVR